MDIAVECGLLMLRKVWKVEISKMKLDREERDLLDSYERGEWKSVKDLKQEIHKHKKYARQTLRKDKRFENDA